MAKSARSNASRWVLRGALVYLAVSFSWMVLHEPPHEQPSILIPEGTHSYAEDEIHDFVLASFSKGRVHQYRAIRKWQSAVRISLEGVPTQEDRESLAVAIRNVKASAPELDLQQGGRGDPTLIIRIVPGEDFSKYHRSASDEGEYFAWTWWQADGAIREGLVLVAAELSPGDRRRRIHWGLLVTLGMLGGNVSLENSLLADQPLPDSGSYSEIDLGFLEMMYRKELSPGSMETRIWATLKGI